MKRLWRRLTALVLTVTLCLCLLPAQAVAALTDNSAEENQRLLAALRAVTGDDASAEEMLSLLRENGLVDEDGKIMTDWSGKITLQAEPQPLDFAGALELRKGTVTVNGRTCEAGELRQVLSSMEELGLLADGQPVEDWELAVNGEPTAPAELAEALELAEEETPTQPEEIPTQPEGGVLAAIGRFLGVGRTTEPAGPVVTVLGGPADADTLLEIIGFLAEYGLLTETGAAADWDMTLPGEARSVTAEEVTAMLEAGELSPDAVVNVDGSPVTVRDLQLILDIEAELRRIQETYFPEGDTQLSQEQAESLLSLYEQLLADGGFQLYSTPGADALTAADFPSGIDRAARVTLEVSGFDGNNREDQSFSVNWSVSDGSDVSFKLRVLDGSGTGLSFPGTGATVVPCEGGEGSQQVALAKWDNSWDNDDLWNGDHVVFVQAYDLEGALFSNDQDSITLPLVLKNDKDLSRDLPIQWSATNTGTTPKSISITDPQKYLLRNDIVTDGAWSYTTSGYKVSTCFAQSGTAGPKDSMWQTQSLNGAAAKPSSLNVYYYQYLKAGASVGTEQICGKEVGYPGDVAQELRYNECFQSYENLLTAGEEKGDPQYDFYKNASKQSAVQPVNGTSPTTDSVASASGSLSAAGWQSLKTADSVTLTATGHWTAAGAGYDVDWGFNTHYYTLQCSYQNNFNVTTSLTLRDTQAPKVDKVTFPAVAEGEEFPAGSRVPVVVHFTEPVQSSGVTITANGQTLEPEEKSTTSQTLTFLYPVQEVDNTYIHVTAVTGVQDVSGNKMTAGIGNGFTSENILAHTPTLLGALNHVEMTAEAGEVTYTEAAGDQPEKTTAAVTVELKLPTESEANGQQFRELLVDSKPDENNRLVSTVLRGVVSIGGEDIPVPLVLDDGQAPTKLTAEFEIDAAVLVEERDFVVELWDLQDERWIFQPYAAFSIDPPVPVEAEDITVTVPASWPRENVFVNAPPKDLRLTAQVTGLDEYTWTKLKWYSSDPNVADIDPDTGVVSLYAPGEVDFYVRGWNGGLEAYQDEDPYPEETGTYCRKAASLVVGEGDAPYLTIPTETITVRVGEAPTLRWASNLVQKNLDYAGKNTATDFTLKVYQGEDTSGSPVATYTIRYDPTQPNGTITMGNGEPISMWTMGEDGTLTPNQSFTLPADLLTETSVGSAASYTLELAAATKAAVPGGVQTFTATAAVVVVSRPVTVSLERPDSFYVTNEGSLDLSYALTSFDAENSASFRLTVTDNATGRTVLDTADYQTYGTSEGGAFTLDLAAADIPDGFRTIYDISLQAKNTAEPDWSRDSFTLYVYDKSALDILVQPVTRNGVTTVGVNGGSVTMSNEAWIASLTQDQILALERDIDLEAVISINYGDHAWGEASDRIQWASEHSDVAAVNYPQAAYYENIENLPYTAYAPATEFLLSGKNDGSTVVEAIHALVGDGLSDSVEVTVETLKDKLYLFQFYPAARATFTYVNGDGQEKQGTTDAQGRAAVYEESGIASDVYVQAEILEGGEMEKYLGTVYQEDLVSQERDAVSLELYPLNDLTLRKAAEAPLTLNKPDGTPYTGKVQVRAGVYRNGEYCAEAVVDPEKNQNGLGKSADYPVTFADGSYRFEFDLTQFSTESQPDAGHANPVTAADEIQFVLELRAEGYYPVLFIVYDSLNEEDAIRLASRVVTLESVPKGQENQPFIARQAVYFSGRERGLGADVRNKSDRVGPSATYPDLLLATTVFWWGSGGGGAGRSLRFTDETGTLLQSQQVETDRYPFCSMPVTYCGVSLNESQFGHLNVTSGNTRSLKMEYINNGKTVKTETMPWQLINAIEVEDAVQSNDLKARAAALAAEIASIKSDGVKVGSDFLTMGIALATQNNISLPGISLKLSPTSDPTTFRGLVSVGLNNIEDDNVSGVDADSGRGSDLDATPGLDAIKGVYGKGVGGYMKSLGNQFQGAASILEGNIRGGSGGVIMTTDRKPYYALQGWFEIEVTYDFTADKWVFTLLTGGATAGAGLGYEWTWNFQAGPVPLVAQLEVGAAATLTFTSIQNPKYNGEDYLTQLRIYAYLQFFGGVGFDYAIVALKLGLYGRLGLDAELQWLNLANGEKLSGQHLDITGEVGAKFQVEALYFISYEKILWSQPFNLLGEDFGRYEDINEYWKAAVTGAGITGADKVDDSKTEGGQRAARASLLMATPDGVGLYAADFEPSFLDRDYLDNYTRSYDSSAPVLEEESGGFSLFSLFSSVANRAEDGSSVVPTIKNSYTQAGPVLSNDGEYLFYLDDLEEENDATAVRAAVMTRNAGNAGYGDPTVLDKEGFGDSGLSTSGSGKDVAVVWSRVMAEPALTEPGQAVTSDVQAQMLNDSDILIAVPDGKNWNVTNLTEGNNVGDLAPVVARNGDNIFVAWRQVASTDTVDVTNFNARDYVYYRYSADGGENWSDAAPIYNGTSGSVKGIEAAMLPDGTAAVTFTLEGAGQDVSRGRYNQNVAYAVVGESSEGYDVLRYAVMEDENLDENPQLAAIRLNGKPVFLLGWHSVSAEDGSSDIRLAAVDQEGNRITGFVDALSDLTANSGTAISADFQFIQNADDLSSLSILWSETAEDETADGSAASRGVISGLRFRTVSENSTPKVSVTAAQRLVEMPEWTSVDSFSAYVDAGTGHIYAAAQGTYYDYAAFESVTVSYDDGTTREVKIPQERTDVYTTVGAYRDRIRVDSVIPDYEHIRQGTSVPVQLSVTNLGTQPITAVTVEIGGKTTVFDQSRGLAPIAPGQLGVLTAQYTVPMEGAIPDPEYTVTGHFANGSSDTAEAGTLVLNVPDLGIADTELLKGAENGQRRLQFTLFNNSDAALAGSGRTVKLGIYSDPDCTKPIESSYFSDIAVQSGEDGALITIDGERELARVDAGACTVQLTFDLASYVAQNTGTEAEPAHAFQDEDGEVRDAGVTLYVNVWVEGQDVDGEPGTLVEYITSNNMASVKLESLLKQANGKPVTITSQLGQNTAGGTQVTVTLRNNSLVNAQDGNLIVTLYDAQGNRLAAQQSYQGGGENNGLESLDPEEIKTFTFDFAESGAARADVTYSKAVLTEDNNAVTQLYFQGIPVTLEDFENQGGGLFAASVQVSQMRSTWVNVVTANPNAAVTLNGEELALGGGNIELAQGTNVLTVTVTSPDGKNTATYELTVRNRYPSSGGTSYSVTAESTAHGTVTVRPSRAQQGDLVVITAKPDEGYRVGEVTVTQDGGKTVAVTDRKDGTYTFIMPRGEVTVNVTFVPDDGTVWVNPFADVPAGAWYHDAVRYVCERGLMAGTGGDLFSPNVTLSRAMLVQILWAMEGKPQSNYLMQYSDVAQDAWYAEAVRWAAGEGIVAGYDSGLFGPDDPVTRQQLALILYNYAQSEGDDTDYDPLALADFTDRAEMADWAAAGLGWAVDKGLLSGVADGILDPNGQATRAQVAVILTQFCQNIAE